MCVRTADNKGIVSAPFLFAYNFSWENTHGNWKPMLEKIYNYLIENSYWKLEKKIDIYIKKCDFYVIMWCICIHITLIKRSIYTLSINKYTNNLLKLFE